MVTQLGMSDLGPIRYEGNANEVFLGRELGSQSGHSVQVGYEIDQQVRKIVGDAYEEAKRIITEHKDQLVTIAEALLEYETLANEEIEYLFKNGEMPYVSGKNDKVEQETVEQKVEEIVVEQVKDNPEDDLLDEMKES